MAVETIEKVEKTTTRKKKVIITLVIIASLLLIIAGIFTGLFLFGKNKYSDKFGPNTYINDFNVSGKTLDEVTTLFEQNSEATELVITKRDGTDIVIPVADFGFKYDTVEKVEEIYNKVDKSQWYKGFFEDKKFDIKIEAVFEEAKLKKLLKASDWGKEKNQNAKITKTDNVFAIQPEVQGDKMDYEKLEAYILQKVQDEVMTIDAVKADCYIAPAITADDLTDELAVFEKAYTQKITFDFDYTTETLTGDRLVDMVKVSKKNTVAVDADKAMKYVEELAEKYDTYNTERKFKATIQGDIVVPTSNDAKYGWWIDQQLTCDLIVDLIKKGEDVEKTDPVYYVGGRGYVFTGREEARTAEDDIGSTYVEVDLSNQKLWHYVDGELKYECYIVSGQTTSAARTTLPGVYKVWQKPRDYTMKGSNQDGEEWESDCSYWTRVAIVGIGLHDASWRGSFGGNIYKWNGSHGCINMPWNGAKYIYENVEMDTPVVMYY